MQVTIELTEEQLASLQVADSQRAATYKTNAAKNPQDVAAYLSHLKHLRTEHYVVVTLNSRGRILRRHVISTGTLDSALVHPRESFLPALRDSAARIILAHNHPSGDCEPSDDDITVTKRMVTAGKILGIPVVDHLIIASGGYYSMQEHGLI
jgi:DNA repair protein RadC